MLNSNGVLSPPGPEHVRCNCTRTQCAPNGGKTLNSTCNLPYCVQQCTTLVCLSARHTPLTACSAGLFLVQTVLRANLQPLLPQPCTNVSLNSWCTSVSPAAACMSGLFIGKLPIQTSLTGGTSGRLHSNTFCMLWRSMLTAATGIFSRAASTAAFITAGSPRHPSTPAPFTWTSAASCRLSPGRRCLLPACQSMSRGKGSSIPCPRGSTAAGSPGEGTARSCA